jgi:hypothetical protein
MRLQRTFIATVSITLVLVTAALAAIVAGSSAFGFDSWPTAPEVSPRESVVAIGGRDALAGGAGDEARSRTPQARPQAGGLLAAAPGSGSGAPEVVAAPSAIAPAPSRRASPAPEAADEPSPSRPDPAHDPVMAPPALPAAGFELPAKQLHDTAEETVPARIDPEQAHGHVRPDRHDGRD